MFVTLLRKFQAEKDIPNAEIARFLAVKPQYISKIVANKTIPPRFELCQKLADALNLSPAEREQLFISAFLERVTDDEKKYLKIVLESDSALSLVRNAVAATSIKSPGLSPAKLPGYVPDDILWEVEKKSRPRSKYNRLTVFINNKPH